MKHIKNQRGYKMRLKRYINEAKMGKLPGRLNRIFWGSDPEMLTWELVNPDGGDDKTNYKYIENLAWKELMDMKRKKVLDFYDNDFNVSIIDNMRDEKTYQAEVILKNYDPDKLNKELRRLKFKSKR